MREDIYRKDIRKWQLRECSLYEFILEPDKKSAFAGNLDVETIILNLSALIPGSRFVSGKTCIILDEIQECKEARTALKSFDMDGRFDVIATGSLLGVEGYGKRKST